jgi:hypothetical protein
VHGCSSPWRISPRPAEIVQSPRRNLQLLSILFPLRRRAMAAPLRVLCLHGIGNHQTDTSWRETWETAVSAGVARWDPLRQIEFLFPIYDDIFEAYPISPGDTTEAALRLLGSGIWHGVQDIFRTRALRGSVPEMLRWTAGMIVQWVENQALRRELRTFVFDQVISAMPDVVCAHSFGSLVAYDAFAHASGRAAPAFAGAMFVTFGSQIGNPFVRAQFAGRIVPVACRRWFHLFNPHDNVFTARLRIADARFEQVDTAFDWPDALDHDAASYLAHANTTDRVWASLAGGARYRALRAARTVVTATAEPEPERGARKRHRMRAASRRALLIGINEYPNPAERLEGCVNDVFEVSALLQESGFMPENIRVVLDDRATAAGIRHRLEWLLSDARAGDQRVLFYSGHGAQLPQYAPDERVDHKKECLVPYDFDWTLERAISDDELTGLYTQLDYRTHFLVMLDCCHSGGMSRDGAPRVRGLDPPDDIRHRALAWDRESQMWVARELPTRALGAHGRDERYAGSDRSTVRLCRAARLRVMERRRYARERAALGHQGPYMPVILQACQESELAYEYRHGVTSYGAFTYAFSRRVRQQKGRGVTFRRLCDSVGTTLRELGYDQRPKVDGPTAWVDAGVPWIGGGRWSRSRN